MTKKVGYLTAFIVVFLIMIFIVSGFAFQNEPEGFRGLKWGDPLTEDMELVEEKNGTTRYVRLEEKLYLGDAKLFRILYHFHHDKFLFVSLDFSGESNYELLKMICRGKFGEESTSNSHYHLQFYWFGSLSNVYLSYRLLEDKKGMLLLSKVEGISEEDRKAKEKKQAEKAEGDW